MDRPDQQSSQGAAEQSFGAPSDQAAADSPLASRPCEPGARPDAAARQAPCLHGRVACWAVPVLLVTGIALIYAQTYRHDFVNIDDEGYVSKNPYVRKGLTAEAVVWAFTTNHTGEWHPLTWISLMLDSRFYGTSFAGGYHLTNVLLHAANAVLLFLLLRQMTGRLWPSALVAALFAIHPTRVESVAWVTERKDVLSGLFGLLALWAYLWYTVAPNIVRYFLVVLMLALGLMAKPVLVTWPFVFLLLDYWPLRRPLGWRLLLEKVPLVIAVASCAAVTFLLQGAGGNVSSLSSVSALARLGRTMSLYLSYMRVSFWPANLSLYAIPKSESYWWGAAAAGVLALLTVGAVELARRGQRWLAVGWFWFLGTFVPTIGLVQVGAQVQADRFLYLPQIGLWIAVVWSAAVDPLRGCPAKSRRIHTGNLAVAAAAFMALFTIAAWRQASFWRDSESLWTHALACDAQNPWAHFSLGLDLQQQHRDDLAEQQFRDALCADPNYALAHYYLGMLREKKGDLDEAVQHYTTAVACNKNLPDAEYSLGSILLKKGDLRGAEPHLIRAIELRGDVPQPLVSLAQLRQQQGADDAAVQLCRAALDLDPALAEAHLVLANSAVRRGNTDDAAKHLRIAMGINPRLAGALVDHALTLLRQGKYQDAVPLLQAVVTFKPDDAGAVVTAAQMLSTAPDPAVRDGKAALELALHAVKLEGNGSLEALNTLAAAYAEAGQFQDAVHTATTARDLALAAGRSDLAAEIQQRLDLFRAGKAFHAGKW